jgi:hypothetical protein
MKRITALCAMVLLAGGAVILGQQGSATPQQSVVRDRAMCPECEKAAEAYKKADAELRAFALAGVFANETARLAAHNNFVEAEEALERCNDKCKPPASSTGRNVKLGGLAAGGIITGLVLGHGGGSGDTTPTTTGGGGATPPVTGPAPPPGTPASDFNGSGTGNISKTDDTCNNGFGASTPISYSVNVDANGNGTYSKTHIVAGVTLIFTAKMNVFSPTTAQMTAISSMLLGGLAYQVTDTVNLIITPTGKTLDIKQKFTRELPPSCSVGYAGTGSGPR